MTSRPARPPWVWSLAGLMLLIASCGDGAGGEGSERGVLAAAEDPAEERIDCRIGEARQYERFCSFELLQQGGEGPIILVRKPDGGFRRLLITSDGRGVVAADGAEPAQVTLVGEDRIDVAIGGDNFRLPARVQPK